ncbi:hypothetical protein SAMN04488057_10514 [Cyclobacterium lianum]|uniref:ParE toxin of type II toxin-antitoxin system, parDE n=1 Tax=Cyclobacterium lianum TaxID=388280 RepID=A0A1M7N231_9BACT|nr:hypothetical protein SAMN04488057_10514 [Cyclobacterium lianum]
MTYRLDFTRLAQKHIAFLKKAGNKSLLNKIAIHLEELNKAFVKWHE